MTTAGYSLPFYHSAVDGLVISNDNNRRYPLMTPPIRTTYIPPSYPLHSNVLRSSTGSILHRIPNHRTLTSTTILRPTNLRWESAINIVDFKTRPLIHQKRNVQNTMIHSSGTKLVRSESLQISNMYSIHNNRILQKSKLDAKHFCGLPPIQENKVVIRQIPPFRPSEMMSR